MKCPHCSGSIGLFSKEMNRFGKSKSCPHCGKGVKVGLIHTRFAAAFIPIAVGSILLGSAGLSQQVSRVVLVRWSAWASSGMRPNPSIERTSSGRLRLPTAAAHVER